MAFLDSLFKGNPASRFAKKNQSMVDAINRLEAGLKTLSVEQLKQKTVELKERLVASDLDAILPEAFALTREAASRTLGQRHYDVQLLGGLALHQGKIAEMRTGEGKTLVCTLPAYLNALSGNGVHVVTVNDYLARRDAVWMGQVYAALGMSVGVINSDASYLYDPEHVSVDSERDAQGAYKVFYEFLKPCTRREAYEADITYGTNNEYGFDYLRDNLAREARQVMQISAKRPKHHYAIVDEVDSILIDESRTPLIIAAPVAESENLYLTFSNLVRNFEKDIDYTVDEKMHAIGVTEAGIEKAEKALGVSNIYAEGGIKNVHHLETAIKAKALYERDRHYVVREGEVVIVDEFTGRLQPGRRWSDGLHQAIEAKEGVELRQESRTFASITFQNYFKLYNKIAGMTGTALTSEEEFMKVYGLEVVPIPTHRPSQRQDLDDLVFQSEKGKFSAVAKKIKELNQKGQPVLVGTVSIEKNELLSAYLNREGVPHQILNAKNHEKEGEIIAQAGKKGGVVIATNMAGRGVDIKLGGADAKPEQAEEVKALGGLYVLGTERHDARRIDNQLRGRSGRQGDPGMTQFYISFDDDLARIFAPQKIKAMMGKLGIPEDEPVQNRLVSRAIESAQTKIEGLHFDSRKHLLDYDNVMNHQRMIIYKRRNDILFGGEPEIAAFLERALADLTIEEQTELRTRLEAKKSELGLDQYVAVTRQLILQVIDMHWVDHLEMMDYLQKAVRLRSVGQRDPLIEYRREGLAAFKEMESHIFENVLKLIPAIGAAPLKEEKSNLQTIHKAVTSLGENRPNQAAVESTKAESKIGRNDPCPCGSGKKFKHCGLINAPEHKK